MCYVVRFEIMYKEVKNSSLLVDMNELEPHSVHMAIDCEWRQALIS